MTSRRLLSPTAKTLLSAAAYLEAHGLCKGNFRSGYDASVCAVGAISACTDDSSVCSHAAETLASHLGIKNIPAWNDNPSRTKDQVAAALRAAALHPMAQQPAPRDDRDDRF